MRRQRDVLLETSPGKDRQCASQGKSYLQSPPLSNIRFAALDKRDRFWRFFGAGRDAARPPTVKLALECLEKLVLPNNLMTSSILPDVSPAAVKADKNGGNLYWVLKRQPRENRMSKGAKDAIPDK